MSVDFKQNMEEILQENFFQISPGKNIRDKVILLERKWHYYVV